MAATQQALLMASDNAVTVPEACVADPYYSCGPTNDPYWANVVLLLHMDGTDGSTTFVDSSTVARTIVAFSSAQVDTANKKFGTGSGYFPTGTNSYLTTGDGYDMPGDFTIEFWLRLDTVTRAGQIVFALTSPSSLNHFYIVAQTNGTASSIGVAVGSATINDLTYDLVVNTWYHIAVARSGSTVTLFKNGVERGTTTTTFSPLSTRVGQVGYEVGTGNSLYGYIDDLRITKGIARYTGNFNIPTAAFPDALEEPEEATISIVEAFKQGATGNTLAIPAHLPGDMLFLVAKSGAAATIPSLPSGWTSIATASNTYSNGLLLAYRVDLIGDLTSVISTNAAQLFGLVLRNAYTVGDFTVNAEALGTVTASIPSLTLTNTYGQSVVVGGVSMNQAGDFSDPSDHTRQWDNLSPALGGGTIAQWGNLPSGTSYVGAAVGLPTAAYLNTWAVEIQAGRIGLLEPRTVLSLHAEDTDDSSCYQPKTVTLAGSAAVSTTEKKFDTASFSVANAGTSTANGVVITDHMDFDFGTGDFTIEMWAYRTANTYYGTLFYGTYGGEFSLIVAPTTGLVVLNYRSSGGAQANIATGVVFPLTTWQHVVVQRRGTNFEFYLNGVLGNTTAITGGASSTVNSTGDFYFGRTNASSALTWAGYIDEVRITKGVARYTAAFDPATMPNCDSVVPGNIVAVPGTSPLTGMSVTVQQQSIGDQNGAVALSNTVIDIGPPLTIRVNRADVFAGNLTVSSVATDKTVALTGRSVTVSRGTLAVPAYPNLISVSTTTIEAVATGNTAKLTFTFFTDGTYTVVDQALTTRTSGTWIDTAQTNYSIPAISNQYRVVTINIFAGTSYTYSTLPFTLGTSFSVVIQNLASSTLNIFDFQLTISPTSTNPRYAEPYYYGTHRFKAVLSNDMS